MGKAMSYGELDLKSRAFASYLQNVARLPRGARVALMMPNLLQYPIAAFGALGRAMWSSTATRSTRRASSITSSPIRAPRRSSFWRTSPPPSKRRSAERRSRTVIVTGAGDQLGGAKGTLVNAVLRHVRRAVPAFRLPQAVRFNRALE